MSVISGAKRQQRKHSLLCDALTLGEHVGKRLLDMGTCTDPQGAAPARPNPESCVPFDNEKLEPRLLGNPSGLHKQCRETPLERDGRVPDGDRHLVVLIHVRLWSQSGLNEGVSEGWRWLERSSPSIMQLPSVVHQFSLTQLITKSNEIYDQRGRERRRGWEGAHQVKKELLPRARRSLRAAWLLIV